MRADTLASSVLLLLLATLVQRSVGFGRGILFCRWLTPEALGRWEMVLSFLLLAAPLAVLGVPGSFGRYAEHFRQRGHLRCFLRRTMAWTAVCCGVAMAIVAVEAPFFAKLILGSDQHSAIMRCVALCLGVVAVHHTLIALMTSLRLYRVATAMTFMQSAVFAAVSLALLCRTPTAGSILLGYGAGCVAASLIGLAWAWPGLFGEPDSGPLLAHRQFWPKLLRFAFFLWAANLLTHLFAIVDRYMIIHYSDLSPTQALEQVGQYHSSRLVPLLLVSFADLLSGLLLPHLSHDWEAGRRSDVARRLNLALKLVSIGMLAFGAAVLASGSLLFGVVLQGRYDGGLLVLPWTLAGCVWYALHMLCQTYLFCAERTRLATISLIAGLVANVTLNLLLLPIWGLYGAVLATALSASCCAVATLLLSRVQGLQVDRGAWIAMLAPVALGFGTSAAAMALLVLIALALSSNLLLSSQERSDLFAATRDQLARLAVRRFGPATAS